MANLLLATSEATDAIAPTVTSEVSDLPGSNLLTPDPGERWRSIGLATQNIDWDMGSAVEFNVAYLGYSNAAGSNSWRIIADDTAGYGSPTYDSGAITIAAATAMGFTRHSAIHYISGGHSARYWRLQISPTGNPDGYFEAGRAFLSNAWQPTENMQFGWDIGLKDPSYSVRSISGTSYPNARGQWRELTFRIENLALAEALDSALWLDIACGARIPILAIPDPALSTKLLEQLSIYGLMEDLDPIRNQTLGYYAKQWRVAEWELP